MFLNLHLRTQYRAWLSQEYNQRQPAEYQGVLHCVRCGYCCLRKTCIPLPSEIPHIAEFLNLSISELVATYMIGDGYPDHNYLRWANTVQQDVVGTFLDAERTFDRGQCVFFNESRHVCNIWPVCPQDAKQYQCWNPQQHLSQWTISQWHPGDIHALVPDFEIE